MNTVFELPVVDGVKPMYPESEELNKVSIEMDTKSLLVNIELQ